MRLCTTMETMEISDRKRVCVCVCVCVYIFMCALTLVLCNMSHKDMAMRVKLIQVRNRFTSGFLLL